MTQIKKTRNKKSNISISQTKNITQKEKQKRTNTKKLSKEEMNITIQPEEIVTSNNSNTNRRKLRSKKRKVIIRINKNVSNLKQISLKESFLNQSKKKCLRSHKKSKSSMNDTLAKKSVVDKKKLPIYESISPENSKENTNEIYEFKFDINDSNERLPRKRKKKATVKKTLINNKRRNVSVKQVNKKKSNTNKFEEIKRTDFVECKNKNSTEPVIESETNVLKDVLMEPVKTDVKVNKELRDSENVIKNVTVDETVTKPTIISIENLSDTKISMMNTSQTSNSNDFKAFKPTNIFNNRKNVLNYSLFEKSLSPIVKSFENPQMSSSPWRPSPFHAFSQVENVVQSTPQSNKYDVLNRRFLRTLYNESKQNRVIAKAKNGLQKNNENMSSERQISSIPPKSKNSFRKFGTEITNIDQSFQSKSSIERIPTEIENIQPNIQSISATSSNVNNIFNFENNENKKSNVLSPKKNFKEEIKNVGSKIHQEHVLGMQTDEQREIFDPQPGTSGLQSQLSIPKPRSILWQSNLNNFLNIMEMPQNTAIKTTHGIFDDIETTAISSRSVTKINKSNMDFKNAFGFSDEDSDQGISSTQGKIKNDKEKTPTQLKTGLKNKKFVTRLSIDEIKNKLVTKKLKEEVHNKENILIENKKTKKLPIEKKNKQIDIVNFSDTFDVLSETGVANSTSNIPLFTDLEPSHFTEPPRHSYKRNRSTSFSFLEENEEEEERMFAHEIKRKKTNKLKKEQEKRLMEWIEDINKTFSEVDQHELVIE
ncbi:hypothetical protein WN48_02434 [Eufriesea mexicana]|nr:hypothetical protein WN48_02434 [Eufriesea mexicana]